MSGWWIHKLRLYEVWSDLCRTSLTAISSFSGLDALHCNIQTLGLLLRFHLLGHLRVWIIAENVKHTWWTTFDGQAHQWQYTPPPRLVRRTPLPMHLKLTPWLRVGSKTMLYCIVMKIHLWSTVYACGTRIAGHLHVVHWNIPNCMMMGCTVVQHY